MKIATSLLAATLLLGSFGAIDTAMGASGIISKQELTPDSYCHLKFPAIREDTLAQLSQPEGQRTGKVNKNNLHNQKVSTTFGLPAVSVRYDPQQ
jgi:hypothetical protein